ncbi:MAG TPA: hypothetical protein VHS96_07410 [Bacteroidia bacterium]|nr:hypothetical protein [Bacteroidia bacterium]
MNRRDFFRLTGLGAGSLLLAPALLGSAWTETWQAQDAVKFAVAHALAQGATYADACIGPCQLIGQHADFAPVGLLETDLLGMRICTAQGWRKLVMREFDQAAIQRNLIPALDSHPALQADREHWIAAHFCKEKVIARHDSDSTLGADLNMAMLRYGQRLSLPQNGPHTLFCDILLHQ